MTCNSYLGKRVDVELSNNFIMKGHRAKLRLAGNSGKPPPIYESLVGIGKLASNPEQRVEITFDKITQKPVVRMLPHISDVIMPNGNKARRIVVDQKDTGELAKIIQRERKRHGVAPLSEEALEKEIKRFQDNATIIENPSIIFERSYSVAFIRHAMIKIAYELAFLWLGEDYIDDPSATELRNAIFATDPNSTDKLPAYISNAEGFEAFKMWPQSETEHLAYAFVNDDGIAIAIRLFNIHAAFVWVTKLQERYISEVGADQKIRFMRINALSGKILNIPLTEEFGRIASEIVVKANI
jgi:hypothetical protein